ncbi:MAG: Do family serine endopeptidase [Alphaproteobacteria bacterium]|nr:Do family serine endopeptidase [Alphaproteobacteria bacterium]
MKKLVLLVCLLSVGMYQNALAYPALPGFADVAEKLLPSVVSVTTSSNQDTDAPSADDGEAFPPGSPYEEFFRQFFDGNVPDVDLRRIASMGSGFIVNADGYILTNNHVIEGSSDILVTMYDGAVYKAEIVGRDKKTDIALIKIKPKKKLVPVEFANSDKLRVGDWVLAIGNPYGLGNTVTAGIVSARARDIQAGPYDDFIQTDVSINRGNSGGPLFNTEGKLVGVNTAIFSPSGGSVGISFAIPANMAKWVLDNLLKDGKIRRGKLGVKVQSVTEEIAETLGLKAKGGALVASVEADGSAAKAGIEPGDVILKFNGVQITAMRNLPRMVAETPVGRTVPVIIWREGKEKSLKVSVDEMPDEDAGRINPEEAKKTPVTALEVLPLDTLGIAVAKLTPALRERYKVSRFVSGVLIVEVKIGSDAAAKGLKAGDVISEMNRSEVQVPEDAEKQLAKAKENGAKSILMLVDGPLGLRFVAVKPTS